MLTLMDRAFQPASSYSDKITFMTSIKHLQSIKYQADKCENVIEKIQDLLTSTDTRLQGLQLLEIAFQQNVHIYSRGNWTVILYDILKEPGSSLFKEQVCNILTMIITHFAKDPTGCMDEIQKFITTVIPFLLTSAETDIEWAESAMRCVRACLGFFSSSLEMHTDKLLNVVMKHINCISSKTFEVFAECYSEIPACMQNADPDVYQKRWKNQYLITLNTMHHILNSFEPLFETDAVTINGVGIHSLNTDFIDEFSKYMTGVQRFINLSKCVAKMISTKTRFAVKLPVKLTLGIIGRMFDPKIVNKLRTPSTESLLLMSTLSQMQIASLALLEPLAKNVNLVPYTYFITKTILYALSMSSASSLSTEPISMIHLAVWKLLHICLGVLGAKLCKDIIDEKKIIEELLRDISYENIPSEPAFELKSVSKGKKNVSLNKNNKGFFVNRNQHIVCKEALRVLESVLCTGAPFLPNDMIQEIFSKIVNIAYAIHPSQDPLPHPYDDEKCRKNLYSVLLTFATISKPDHREPILSAAAIFKNARLDSSIKVTSLCHKAAAMCHLYLHPKKPPPMHFIDSEDQQKRFESPNAMVRYSEWLSEEYVENISSIESTSNASENLLPGVVQTFRNPNENEIRSDDYLQTEAHYAEQISDTQCNGEDILEVQNSSQSQDDDGEYDEDEDRSYCEEEEMNQDTGMQQSLYIPSTSNELQNLKPVRINPENLAEQEYEELRPCSRTQGNVLNSSKNMHLNGVRRVPVEEIPSSSSSQNVANENGVYESEDEEMIEDEGDDDDMDEEESSFTAEKKVPEIYDAPPKKQKIDYDEVQTDPKDAERDQRSRSPTLVEMKADFCFSEVDDVKS